MPWISLCAVTEIGFNTVYLVILQHIWLSYNSPAVEVKENQRQPALANRKTSCPNTFSALEHSLVCFLRIQSHFDDFKIPL